MDLASIESVTPSTPSHRLAPWALAIASGLLYAASLPGIGQFYLAFVAFVPMVWAARDATPRRALGIGFVMAMVAYLIDYEWVTQLLAGFGGVPLPVAVLGWIGFCVLAALSFALSLALARWLQRRTGWPWAVVLPVSLTAMDFVYPMVFTSYVADAMSGATWMMQTADLFGVLGITALLGAINGATVDVLIARRAGRPFPTRAVGVTATALAFAIVYGAVRTAQVDREASTAPMLRVGLVQSNVAHAIQMEDRIASARTHQRLTRALSEQGVDLVVWPEGAFDYFVPPTMDVRRQILNGVSQALLFGGARSDTDAVSGLRRDFNSAFLADSVGRVIGHYDKHDLLIFGEYLPFGARFPKIYEWAGNRPHWDRGPSTAPPLILGDWRLATMICYEAIIPERVRTIMQPTNGVRPNLLVNITQDSWYGPYLEQEEHLALATFRAVEHRRAFVRSTNTGVSAFISPTGRVMARAPKAVEATLVGLVPRMEGTTVYEIVGDAAGYAALVVVAAGYLIGRARPRSI